MKYLIILVLAFILWSCSSNDNNTEDNQNQVKSQSFSTPPFVQMSNLGNIYTIQGFSLYIFENDMPGISNCYDNCAEIWPPLYATEQAQAEGDFSIIEREDGSLQWAFKNYPLYFYYLDVQQGDTFGEGVNAVWYLARPDPFVEQTTTLGHTYVGENGLTLYTFLQDMPGVSNCNDNCAEIWPPLYAATGSKPSNDFSIITRADGSQQWAFQEYPLYYYYLDENPGDILGEGINDIWYIARPKPITIQKTSLGEVYAGKNELTLYTFTNDSPNTATCYDNCAEIWPPLYAAPNSQAYENFSIIERQDGSLQWAYQQYPLYYYHLDENPGDVLGEGVNGVWFVATP